MIYALQADIDANPESNVSLFIPGKTQLTPQDIFLGGTGTGVSDSMIGNTTRVFGDTAKGTSAALSSYNQDLYSQTRNAQAQNYAPRIDAAMGMPTGERLDMEIGQAQAAIDNPMKAAVLTGRFDNRDTLAQKEYDRNVRNDALSNEYNVGNMMGSYRGSPTLSKQAQAIQGSQFNANLNQDESQFGRTLASGNYNSAADRTLSQQKANQPTATAEKANNTAMAYIDIQSALDQGKTPDEVKQNILSHSGDYASIGISPSSLISQVDAIVKSWGDSESNPNVANTSAMAAWNSLNKMWVK